MSGETTVHGTCMAVGCVGVLLVGPSGIGKSDLALRLIQTPPRSIAEAVLVADDQVRLVRREGGLIASAPETLRGRLEVRGLGILELPAVDEVELKLVAELTEAGQVERMPDHSRIRRDILGIDVPVLRLDPFEASAHLKLALAVSNLDTLFPA